MIDWWDVGVNALWIAGLAIFLAAVSYHSAAKAHAKDKPRLLWSGEIWPAAGLALFCLGLGLSSAETWKQIVWLVLMLLSISQPFISRWIEKRQKAKRE
jgi:cell division protein FtsW (lipid II flippase)